MGADHEPELRLQAPQIHGGALCSRSRTKFQTAGRGVLALVKLTPARVDPAKLREPLPPELVYTRFEPVPLSPKNGRRRVEMGARPVFRRRWNILSSLGAEGRTGLVVDRGPRSHRDGARRKRLSRDLRERLIRRRTLRVCALERTTGSRS